MSKLLWRLREVGLEAVEVGPKHAGLREVIDELTFLLGSDEPGGFELPHMVR